MECAGEGAAAVVDVGAGIGGVGVVDETTSRVSWFRSTFTSAGVDHGACGMK